MQPEGGEYEQALIELIEIHRSRTSTSGSSDENELCLECIFISKYDFYPSKIKSTGLNYYSSSVWVYLDMDLGRLQKQANDKDDQLFVMLEKDDGTPTGIAITKGYREKSTLDGGSNSTGKKSWQRDIMSLPDRIILQNGTFCKFSGATSKVVMLKPVTKIKLYGIRVNVKADPMEREGIRTFLNFKEALETWDPANLLELPERILSKFDLTKQHLPRSLFEDVNLIKYGPRSHISRGVVLFVNNHSCPPDLTRYSIYKDNRRIVVIPRFGYTTPDNKAITIHKSEWDVPIEQVDAQIPEVVDPLMILALENKILARERPESKGEQTARVLSKLLTEELTVMSMEQHTNVPGKTYKAEVILWEEHCHYTGITCINTWMAIMKVHMIPHIIIANVDMDRSSARYSNQEVDSKLPKTFVLSTRTVGWKLREYLTDHGIPTSKKTAINILEYLRSGKSRLFYPKPNINRLHSHGDKTIYNLTELPARESAEILDSSTPWNLYTLLETKPESAINSTEAGDEFIAKEMLTRPYLVLYAVKPRKEGKKGKRGGGDDDDDISKPGKKKKECDSRSLKL